MKTMELVQDHSDPMFIMFEHFRLEVMKIAVESDKITIFRELSNQKKVEIMMQGMMTGMAALALITVAESEREALTSWLIHSFPFAIENSKPYISEIDSAIPGRSNPNGK